MLGADPAVQLGEVRFPGCGRSGGRHRAGQADELAQLAVSVRGQGHDRDRADPLQAEVERGKEPGVRQLQHHPVAWPQAQVEQVQRDPLRGVGQLRVGIGTGVVDDGHAVGEPVEGVEEMRDDRTVSPVAARPVASGELGRERRHPGQGHRASSSGWFTQRSQPASHYGFG